MFLSSSHSPIRLAFYTMALLLSLATLTHAETVPIQYVEPNESASANLDYCTIYRCFGKTCLDWYPIKNVDASAPVGGGTINTTVNIAVAASERPKSVRFAVSCTNTSGNEGPKVLTGTGNPITFVP